MQYDVTSSKRRLEPRWRALSRTPTYEIVSQEHSPTASDARLMQRYLKRWELNPTLIEAADLVDAAIRTGDYASAVPAAMKIVDWGHARDGLMESAQQVLRTGPNRPSPLLNPVEEWDDDLLAPALRRLKRRLALMPRDALTALEIARLQSQVGQRRSAIRYVERALACAPNDRYVLRSAANFFSHRSVQEDIGMISRAIATSDVVRFDPWVQAAELSVANISGKSPRWALKAREKVEDAFQNPKSISELAAGLAVLEHSAGAPRRRVNKLLRASLRSPTENSLAQAIWSKQEIGFDLDVTSHLATIRNAFEARARAAFEQNDYLIAAEQSWLWLMDQHLSPLAAQYGAFLSTAMLADYKNALDFANYGLRADPNSAFLLNSKLISHAFLGQSSEAEKLLPKLEMFESDPKIKPFVFAAKGLLAFRRGSVPTGREWYSRAISSAIDAKLPTLAANAKVYWLEQEVSAGSISNELAEMAISKLDHTFSRKEYDRTKTAIWSSRKKIIEHLIKTNRMKQDILRNVSRIQTSPSLAGPAALLEDNSPTEIVNSGDNS